MMQLNDKQIVIASIAAYSFCSGTLILLNKLTLHFIPFPSLVVSFQLAVAIALIFGAKLSGVIEVDDLQWEYVKPYLLYVFFFSTGIYCNMRSLNVSNVETIIVFRALSPIIVAMLDAMFLGREWPSYRSWAGLLTLVIGAYGYASFDEQFHTQGYSAYSWPSLYTIIIAMEMAYGKKIVKSVPLKTQSGPVFYTNLIGFVPMLMLANVSNEYAGFWEFYWGQDSGKLPLAAIILLAVGSFVGTGIGYSSWWCRGLVSATSFTLIGVMNKCLTVILNTFIWDAHAKPGGIACLFVCIAGGMIYQQAPMRSDQKAALPIKADDVEFESDIGSDDELEVLVDSSKTTKRRA